MDVPGTPAMTSRGCLEADFETIADFLLRAAQIASVVQREHGKMQKAFLKGLESNKDIVELRTRVETFATQFVMPGFDGWKSFWDCILLRIAIFHSWQSSAAHGNKSQFSSLFYCFCSAQSFSNCFCRCQHFTIVNPPHLGTEWCCHVDGGQAILVIHWSAYMGKWPWWRRTSNTRCLSASKRLMIMMFAEQWLLSNWILHAPLKVFKALLNIYLWIWYTPWIRVLVNFQIIPCILTLHISFLTAPNNSNCHAAENRLWLYLYTVFWNFAFPIGPWRSILGKQLHDTLPILFCCGDLRLVPSCFSAVYHYIQSSVLVFALTNGIPQYVLLESKKSSYAMPCSVKEKQSRENCVGHKLYFSFLKSKFRSSSLFQHWRVVHIPPNFIKAFGGWVINQSAFLLPAWYQKENPNSSLPRLRRQLSYT